MLITYFNRLWDPRVKGAHCASLLCFNFGITGTVSEPIGRNRVALQGCIAVHETLDQDMEQTPGSVHCCIVSWMYGPGPGPWSGIIDWCLLKFKLYHWLCSGLELTENWYFESVVKEFTVEPLIPEVEVVSSLCGCKLGVALCGWDNSVGPVEVGSDWLRPLHSQCRVQFSIWWTELWVFNMGFFFRSV